MGVSIHIYRARIGLFGAKRIKPSCSLKTSFSTCAINFLKLAFLLLKFLSCILVYKFIFICLITKILFFTFLSFLITIHKNPSYIPRWLASRCVSCAMPFLMGKSPYVLDIICLLCIYSIINKELLLRSGDIHSNPGPAKLSFATWNIDSILARDAIKLPILESIVDTYNFDIFGICETYLSGSIPNDKIMLNGFASAPFRADCKNIDTRAKGGVCLYYKEHLPIKRRKDLENLDECIVVEINLNRKKILYALVYRTPSQTNNECKLFADRMTYLYDKMSSEKPDNIIITGDFNARSPIFWNNEITETTEGKIISDFMLLNGLEEVINEPTHFPRGDIATCIDLIFTSQRCAFVDSGTLPSPDPACKHQIIYGKLNYSVPCPPPYKRKLWDYNLADIHEIRRHLKNTNWEQILANKSPDEMVDFFNKVFLNTMNKLIPYKDVTINERDAPWVTPEVKSALRRNARSYKRWVKNGRNPITKNIVHQHQVDIKKLIERTKASYINNLCNKITDNSNGQKIFWAAYNRLLNKKKISNIPPLLENDEYVSDFKTKASIFNEYFALQCRPLAINCVLPKFSARTNQTLNSVFISEDKIIQVIEKLSSKKAHGFDGISIAMLKICSREIAVPLCFIYKSCLKAGKFPSNWKRANVQPVHKKNSRQEKGNYRPISLLPICGKIFEKVIFDSLYPYLNNNNLLNKNQSGFRPGDSTINQLLSITDEIFRAFESFDETRAIFLDISKAFDKVWHDGLLFKLRQYGIGGDVLSLLTDFLSDREQRVVLNGLQSDWQKILSGVPQGSVLGPLLFLIYINDLTDNISSNIKLFADDSSLFIKVQDIDTAHSLLNSDLDKITEWAYQWKMQFNPDITKQAIEVIFSWKHNKPVHPFLTFNDIPVARKTSTKHLGIILDEKLTFRLHISEAIIKAKKGISILKFLARYVNREVLDMTYKMYVRPYLDYGDVIFHNQSMESMTLIEQLQYQASLIVSGCWQGSSRLKVYSDLGWESLDERRKFHRLSLYYKIQNNDTPEYLRANVLDSLPVQGTNRYMNSYFPFCYKHWNDLDPTIKNSENLSTFKSKVVKSIRPERKSCYFIKDRYGLSLLARIRVDHSDLRSHRFDKKFNCINPTCACGIEDETPEHFFLRCTLFAPQRASLLASISDIVNPEIINLPHDHLTAIILFGSKVYKFTTNKSILEASICFIKQTKRFKKLEAYS